MIFFIFLIIKCGTIFITRASEWVTLNTKIKFQIINGLQLNCLSSRSTPLNASAFGVTLDSSVKSRPAQQTKSTSPGRLQFGVIICYHKIKR